MCAWVGGGETKYFIPSGGQPLDLPLVNNVTDTVAW